MVQIVPKDLRQQVKNRDIHPYNGIGKIVAKLYGKNQIMLSSTAFIISKNLIITCANAIHFKEINKIADDIQFFPVQLLRQNQKSQRGIKASVIYLRKEYFNQPNQFAKKFDFVILELQQNNIINDNQILELDLNYNFKKEDIFNISSYALDTNKQYYQENKAARQENDCLFYKHTTDWGYSGAPVLLKKQQNSYVVVGIHKGTIKNHNYGPFIKCLNHELENALQIKFTPSIGLKQLSQKFHRFYIKQFIQRIQKDFQFSQLEKQNIELKQILKKAQNNIEEKQININNSTKKIKQIQQTIQKIQKQGEIKLLLEIKSNQSDFYSKNPLESSILDKQGLNLLVKWINKPISSIQQKFKASNYGFKIKNYFEICGDLKNTIIIAKTTKGKIIGGFTPLSFNPSVNWTSQFDYEDIEDLSNSSFVFVLSQKEKFQLIKNKAAITRWKDKNRINFNNTLFIVDQSNKSNKYKSNLSQFCLYDDPPNYETSKYLDRKESYLKITGSQEHTFKTIQWQVFQVFFK